MLTSGNSPMHAHRAPLAPFFSFAASILDSALRHVREGHSNL